MRNQREIYRESERRTALQKALEKPEYSPRSEPERILPNAFGTRLGKKWFCHACLCVIIIHRSVRLLHLTVANSSLFTDELILKSCNTEVSIKLLKLYVSNDCNRLHQACEIVLQTAACTEGGNHTLKMYGYDSIPISSIALHTNLRMLSGFVRLRLEMTKNHSRYEPESGSTDVGCG